MFYWTVTDRRRKSCGGALPSGYLSKVRPGLRDYKRGVLSSRGMAQKWRLRAKWWAGERELMPGTKGRSAENMDVLAQSMETTCCPHEAGFLEDSIWQTWNIELIESGACYRTRLFYSGWGDKITEWYLWLLPSHWAYRPPAHLQELLLCLASFT